MASHRLARFAARKASPAPARAKTPVYSSCIAATPQFHSLQNIPRRRRHDLNAGQCIGKRGREGIACAKTGHADENQLVAKNLRIDVTIYHVDQRISRDRAAAAMEIDRHGAKSVAFDVP